ncbi:hypothetical protein GCM10010365_46910 [Streptomyces poonensis]|uniref:Uncharacterized protein n=1 Tax=Streptomyces poonensis TaxID=68255 RepID=A0A918PSH2_9ACTN|nr:hypothetical protein GCM10010365_46910 [Streptomyces poonensis]
MVATSANNDVHSGVWSFFMFPPSLLQASPVRAGEEVVEEKKPGDRPHQPRPEIGARGTHASGAPTRRGTTVISTAGGEGEQGKHNQGEGHGRALSGEADGSADQTSRLTSARS